jgi:hypothetical protein
MILATVNNQLITICHFYAPSSWHVIRPIRAALGDIYARKTLVILSGDVHSSGDVIRVAWEGCFIMGDPENIHWLILIRLLRSCFCVLLRLCAM